MIGIGFVRTRMFDGMERVLENVRQIPELKKNLISLGMLDDQGCIFRAEKAVMRASKGSLIIMKKVKKNDLYSLIGNTIMR